MKAAIMVAGADGGTWDVRDVQRPVVTPGHVLIRVRASSLNRAEFRRLHALHARPGQPAPEARTGGGDAAGEVVETGAGVSTPGHVGGTAPKVIGPVAVVKILASSASLIPRSPAALPTPIVFVGSAVRMTTPPAAGV